MKYERLNSRGEFFNLNCMPLSNTCRCVNSIFSEHHTGRLILFDYVFLRVTYMWRSIYLFDRVLGFS
jgi:hypothetical protein